MRLPRHLKRNLPRGDQSARTRQLLCDLRLDTICDEARCPNRVECHAHGTATFLLMGDTCARDCGFCSVKTGRPDALDPTEPARIAEAVRRLALRHVVITSVTRDDLPDGGAAHFAATVGAVRKVTPRVTIELLTPDLRGDLDAVNTVLDAAPDVFGHNVETVARLTATVRHRADFKRSLRVLRHVKRRHPRRWTKSGLMLGLGERPEEVAETLRALRDAEVDIVTLGQYLQPTPRQIPVAEFIKPATFDRHAETARAMGFHHVLAGPFVRSSYLADQAIPA